MLSERQQQIISESIRLIDEKGIQGFTIKNLSKKIGISEPGIYRHFESKFQILNTILESFKQNVIKNQVVFSEHEIDPFERLKMFFNNTFTTLSNNRTFVTVIFSEEIFQNEKNLSDKVFEIQELNEKMIGSILTEMKAKNEISADLDIEMFTIMLFGSIRMIVRKWKASNYSFSLIEKGNYLFSTIINLAK